MPIAKRGIDDFFGEISLLQNSSITADAYDTIEDRRCFVLYKSDFLKFISEDFVLSLFFEEVRSERLYEPIFPLRGRSFECISAALESTQKRLEPNGEPYITLCMIRPLLLACAALFSSQTASAQIYADVTVSQGQSSLGTFRILLYHDLAPRTVANFIGLATGERTWIDPETGAIQVNQPYYDGIIFHRLIHKFVIQGGDPLGTGSGGPGYVFQDEFDPSLSHVEYGVSMANSGALSNGSQFFINLSAPTFLDNKHSVFGLVIDDASYPNGRALIDGFKNSTNFRTDASDRPLIPITIDSISFSGPDYASFDVNAPGLGLPEVSPLTMTISHTASTGEFNLEWEAERKFDYPLYFGSDLTAWSLAGKVLTMSDNASFDINIDSIATGSQGFYQATKVDYSAFPEAPQNVVSNGNVLDLASNGGTLRLNFNGSGGGFWRFIYADGVTPDDSGIISAEQTNSTSFPVIPSSGTFVNNSGQTYGRFIGVRQITVFLDREAGPDLLTAVQPVLSFHQTAGGWFDGLVNANSPSSVTFRGEFTIETE